MVHPGPDRPKEEALELQRLRWSPISSLAKLPLQLTSALQGRRLGNQQQEAGRHLKLGVVREIDGVTVLSLLPLALLPTLALPCLHAALAVLQLYAQNDCVVSVKVPPEFHGVVYKVRKGRQRVLKDRTKSRSILNSCCAPTLLTDSLCAAFLRGAGANQGIDAHRNLPGAPGER